MGIRGADFDITLGHVENAPGLRTQAELVAEPALPHEFLVELADDSFAIGEAQVVVAAIWNGAAGLVENEFGTSAGGEGVLHTIHEGTRFQLANRGVSIATREHGDHQVEVAAWQRVVGRHGAHEGEELVKIPDGIAAHGQKYLGQHVEGISDRLNLFYVASADHPLHGSRLRAVEAVKKEKTGLAGSAHTVIGAADALD